MCIRDRFQQSDDNEDQSNDCSESAKSFESATKHNFNPVTNMNYDLLSNGSGATSRRANCVVSPVRKLVASTGLELATTDGGGRLESNRTIRSDALPRRM